MQIDTVVLDVPSRAIPGSIAARMLLTGNVFHVEKCMQLMTVPTNSKVFLRGLLNMQEKQILTSVIEIQKEKWG